MKRLIAILVLTFLVSSIMGITIQLKSGNYVSKLMLRFGDMNEIITDNNVLLKIHKSDILKVMSDDNNDITEYFFSDDYVKTLEKPTAPFNIRQISTEGNVDNRLAPNTQPIVYNYVVSKETAQIIASPLWLIGGTMAAAFLITTISLIMIGVK